jgi:hypothetical protein
MAPLPRIAHFGVDGALRRPPPNRGIRPALKHRPAPLRRGREEGLELFRALRQRRPERIAVQLWLATIYRAGSARAEAALTSRDPDASASQVSQSAAADAMSQAGSSFSRRIRPCTLCQ